MLKSFATALTRVELNEADIKSIVGDLEQLGVIDWDVTQVRILIFGTGDRFLYRLEIYVNLFFFN